MIAGVLGCRRLPAGFRSSCPCGRLLPVLLLLLIAVLWLCFLWAWLSGMRRLDHSSSSFILKTRMMPVGGADVRLDQPWSLQSAVIFSNWSLLESGERYILSDLDYSKGLGNMMFEFAALHFFADKFNATIVLPSTCLLRRAFGGLRRTRFMADETLAGYLLLLTEREQAFHEYKARSSSLACCDFVPDLRLFEDGRRVEVVRGYFQSYRNFHPRLQKEIRESFTFLPEVQRRAREILQQVTQKALAEMSEDERNTTFVGVHVRHGADVTMHGRNLFHGHVSAPPSFYEHAMQKMRNELNGRKLVFVIVGDDDAWIQRNLAPFAVTRGEIQFVNSGFREVDMAVLTLCDHTIMSTGTFSWWAAYLTGGQTIYYGGWPKRGTVLYIMVSRAQFFLPEWKAVV